jgi:hypothetical protein
VEVDTSYKIPLPCEDPNSWAQENCSEAFKELSRSWALHLIPDATNLLMLSKISETDFSGWVRARSYHRPKFWAEGKTRGDSVLTAVSPSDSAHKRRGRPAVVFRRVVAEMLENISQDKTAPDGLWGTTEKVLADKYRCSRDTVRKARAQAAPRVEN